MTKLLPAVSLTAITEVLSEIVQKYFFLADTLDF